MVGRSGGGPARPSFQAGPGFRAAPGCGLPPFLAGTYPNLFGTMPARAQGARVRADPAAGARPADRLDRRLRSSVPAVPRVPEQEDRPGLRVWWRDVIGALDDQHGPW